MIEHDQWLDVLRSAAQRGVLIDRIMDLTPQQIFDTYFEFDREKESAVDKLRKMNLELAAQGKKPRTPQWLFGGISTCRQVVQAIR